MIHLPFFSSKNDHLAALYGDIVAASRAPVAYLDYGVSDDFEGRFERLTLITTLVLRRLRGLPPPAASIAQDLVDRLFADLDDGLRRAGIGDLAVPKRMKKLAQAFYGRAEAYTAALDAQDEAGLRAALARNMHDSRLAPEAVPEAQMEEIHRLTAGLETLGCNGLLAGDTLAALAGRERVV